MRGRRYEFKAVRPGEPPTRTCRLCGAEFEPVQRLQAFCCRKHTQAWHNGRLRGKEGPWNPSSSSSR